MEAAGPIIDIVVESLMARIKKELGYWWNSKKNVEDMSKGIDQLNHAAQDMKRKKEDNDVKNLVVPHHVPTWLEEVDKIKKEADRVPTDGIGIGCFNIKMSYKAGKQSFGILERIRGLKENKTEIVWTDEQIPLARVPSRYHASTSSPVDDGTQNSFGSRDLVFKEALKALEPKNSKTHMMALCGMGGVGKSHMMERLKKAVEYSKMFYWIVKVVVGENIDIVALQHAVAEKTGGVLTTTTTDARAELLNKRFTQTSQGGEKKILVILDDVWKELDLKDLGLPTPLPNGFKLLITSRDANVCTQMGVDTDLIFRIGALNDDEAKILFFETVGLSKDDDPDLYRIGEDIIRRCCNLPIALKTIASTLKGSIRDESDWKEALSRLQHNDLQNHYKTVHEVFKISYDRLQKDDEKAIYLLSGLFPDDYDIPMEELVRYTWGLKLFSRTTLARARLRVEGCVKSLIRANLLAESDRIGCVRMHDLSRAFALSNSTEVKQASIVKHIDISDQFTEDENESYQRILLKCTDLYEFPKDFNCPNLKFFKVMGRYEHLKFPEDLYESMEKLEVLSYEDMLYPPVLPRLSQCSTHLRTLCLHGCELISDWSDIGYLVNLEVLSFAGSRISKLPSLIGKLKKLKLLDLNGCRDLCIDDGVFRELDKLEELYMRVSGHKAIRFTEANCNELKKLSVKLSALEVEFFDNGANPKNMSFENLERFRISIGCLLEVNKYKYSYENTLRLITNMSDLLDCKINELFKKTEDLYLKVEDMKHLRDVIRMHPPQDPFSKLRALEVNGCKNLRYLFTVDIASGLRKLEQLEIADCPDLESVIHGDESENVEVIKFQELKFMYLLSLPKLVNLCDIDKVVELPQLVEVKLIILSNITSIYPDSEMQSFFNKQVMIPKLETLYIHHMKKLKQIWPSKVNSGEEVQISMVRVMVVDNCDSLVNLFPCNPMPWLRNLESLHVYHCNSIEVLFNIDLGRNGKIEEVSSSLESIHVKHSRNLREVWRIKGANNSQISGFQALENIHIHGCRRFKYVFTPPTTNLDMRALLDIDVGYSNDLLINLALISLQPNNRATKIAVCGIESVRKTTMMNQIIEKFEGIGMFDLVLKLNIGREVNPIALQQAIAEYIGEDLTETAKEARAEHLHNRIVEMSQDGQTKILVILDDLWKVLDLKDIGLPSPLPNCFKLLITSRDVNICAQMGVEKSSIFRLDVVDDAEAKSSFSETVGQLKDEKEILFLSSFFPGDSDIPVEELMRYAWGLKLFPEVYTTLAQARQRIKASIDVLIRANLITSDRVGWINVQQDARDFVLSNFTEVKQASFDHGNMPEDADESFESIFFNCTGMSEFQEDLFNYPNLKLLKLRGEEKIVKFHQDLYSRMENLEVVAYERMVNPLLPSYSTNLRTLYLNSCLLTDDISFLGNLINLETLSFAHCGILKLPSTIGNLRKLKLLDVTGCADICIEDGVFLNLVNLEELYMRAYYGSPIRFTDANYEELGLLLRQLRALEAEFNENKLHLKDDSFEKLEKFRISIGGQLGNDDDMHYSENTMSLVCNRSEVVECKMNELFEKTGRLYLQMTDIKNLEDVSMHHSFCNLKELQVSDCTELKFLFTADVASALTKLEILSVYTCPVLETLIHGESGGGGSVISFPKLKSLDLWKLPRLMSLCDTEDRVELQQLVALSLTDLDNLSSIYPDNAIVAYALFNKQVHIPNLEELRISSMEKLMQIWPYENTAIVSEKEDVKNNNISMLRNIYVFRCESLVNLFPCNPLPLLTHLERLVVYDCSSIEVLINIDLRGAAGNINELTSSLREIEVGRLEKLREIWRIEGGNNSSGLLISSFQAVEKINIRGCKRFKDIFAPKNINFDMRAQVTIEE